MGTKTFPYLWDTLFVDSTEIFGGKFLLCANYQQSYRELQEKTKSNVLKPLGLVQMVSEEIFFVFFWKVTLLFVMKNISGILLLLIGLRLIVILLRRLIECRLFLLGTLLNLAN